MHNIFESIRLKLQFFAEGASGEGGAGDGAASVGTTAVDGQIDNALESLGVPKDKAEKYRARKAKNAPAPAPKQAPEVSEPVATEQQDAAAEAEVDPDEAAWEEAKKNPVINKRMQDTVNARLKDYAKKNGDAQATLAALAPALELVGKKVGLDVSDISKLDVSAFVNAVNSDPSYFEDLAAEMGTNTETARNVYNREREARMAEETARQQREEIQFRNHYNGLVQQAEELKANGYADLDLQKELEDPWFVRVTSPTGGLSVKQALDAKYHDAIVANKVAAAAQRTQAAISQSMQNRANVPKENGSVSRSAVPTVNKPYSQMNKQEREAYKQALIRQSRR